VAHETASWRAIRDENHPWGDFSVRASENTLAGRGSDPDGTSWKDSDRSHIVWVHDKGADESLVFGVVFANVNLLALLRRAARVHYEPPGRHWGTPLRRMATRDLGLIPVVSAARNTEFYQSEPIAFTGRGDESSFYVFRGEGKGNAASDCRIPPSHQSTPLSNSQPLTDDEMRHFLPLSTIR